MATESPERTGNIALPRVAITYCTQCKWMLRAAYFGQELLSTFGTSIGEIALIPATGGIFTVYLTYRPDAAAADAQEVLLWDRKAEGGFPETKIVVQLKQRLRNHIEPEKKLGHSDTPSAKAGSAQDDDAARDGPSAAATSEPPSTGQSGSTQECEDCK
ncbi:Rdx family [Teratosphaeria destructans]|uniref:Rdx family n=1 Tax=Teratosphaeria destructans TaxID=418781 RepID=A0A9W7W052_9PEZI|nr:Rdx family [Teratosphaeria destructans]